MTIPSTMASTTASRNVSHGERFNRRPLYITVVIVSLFAYGLYYAAESRIAPQETYENEPDNIDVLNNGQDYQTIDFIQGQSDGLVNAIAPINDTDSNDDSKSVRESDIADRLALMIEQSQLDELDRNNKIQKQLLSRQFELAQQALEGDIDIQGFGDNNRTKSSAGAVPGTIIPASGQERRGRGNAGTFNPNSQSNISSGSSANAALLGSAITSSTDVSGVIENRDFVSGDYRNDFTLSEPVNKPNTKYQVMTGTLIPGVMISAANSELPGDLVAQITQDVYDSVIGRYILIPQGTKLFGRYDSFAALGTERLLMVWDRLVLPDGESMTIGSIQGYDDRGLSGAKDIIRTRFWRTLANSFLLSVATAAADSIVDETAKSENILADISANFGTTTTSAFDEYLRNRLKIKPTFEIRSGYRFNIIVNRDIDFPEPYEFGYTRLELQ